MLRGIHHVGLTVSDIERSIDFYRRALCCEVTQTGVAEGEEVGRTQGLGDVRIRYAYLTAGGGSLLELLQYDRPAGTQTIAYGRADTGAGHVCFVVDDIDATHERLLGEKVTVLAGPLDFVSSGIRALYFLDPDGILLQIYQLPS